MSKFRHATAGKIVMVEVWSKGRKLSEHGPHIVVKDKGGRYIMYDKFKIYLNEIGEGNKVTVLS